jgi:uncharacterized protein involved in tolerance to divalent cations
LTDEEIKLIYKVTPSAMNRILNNQSEWHGYAEMAKAVREGYMEYLSKLFGGETKK